MRALTHRQRAGIAPEVLPRIFAAVLHDEGGKIIAVSASRCLWHRDEPRRHPWRYPSQPGRGVSARIYLPARKAVHQRQSTMRIKICTARKRFSLVDDEVMLLSMNETI